MLSRDPSLRLLIFIDIILMLQINCNVMAVRVRLCVRLLYMYSSYWYSIVVCGSISASNAYLYHLMTLEMSRTYVAAAY